MRPGHLGREAARVAGFLLAIPALVLVALGLEASYSVWGWVMLLAVAVVLGGMITAPRRRERRGGVVRAGVGILALVMVSRTIAAAGIS